MIYDILPVNNYIGNALSKTFDFDFYIDNESQIKVYLFDKDNIKHELKYGVDFDVEGEKNQNGGKIIFPLEGSKYGVLSEKEKISIELDIPASQETQYNNSSLLNLKSLEYSFDYVTRLIQILKRKLSLCVKVEECSDNSPQELIESINNANDSAKNSAKEALSLKQDTQNILAQTTALNESTNQTYEKILNIKTEIEDSGMYKFQMFDMVIKDHILSHSESLGFALQGTYVYKEPLDDTRYGYSDFYNRCLKEKEESTPVEVTFGSDTITLYINPNGHQFYDIADKEIIDAQYQALGIADYYGIDIQNERIFLPRNDYFLQMTPDTSKVNTMIDAGLPNIKGTVGTAMLSRTDSTGAFSSKNVGQYRLYYDTSNWSKDIKFNASSYNSIYGASDTVQPKSSLKLLYYVVGNTKIQTAFSSVQEISSSKNDTIPLGFSFYQGKGLKLTTAWLKSLGQWNSGLLYKSFYAYCTQNISKAFAAGYIKKCTEDYTEYDLVVNDDLMLFRLPLKNGQETAVEESLLSSYDLYFKVANSLENTQLLDMGAALDAISLKLETNLSNITLEGEQKITSCAMPDYSAKVIPTSPFSVPSDGFLFCLFGSGQNLELSIKEPNGKTYKVQTLGTYPNDMSSIFFPVSKDSIVTSNFPNYHYFYPCKGGK